MSKESKKIGPLQRRALIEPTSVNVESRTFTVAFATETPVLMSSWWEGDFYEVLGMEGMRTARLESGAPLLDNHQRHGSVAQDVIGVVQRHWIEGQTAYAEVQLSAREELAGLLQDIKDGIIRNISCGYRVYAYAETSRKDVDKIPTYRATDWEPFEVSLVPVGADPTASVRSRSEGQELNLVEFSSSESKQDMQETPKPSAPDIEAERAAGVKAERERVAAIMQSVRSLNLPEAFADGLINEGVSAADAAQRAIAEWAKQDPTKGVAKQAHIETGADERDKRRAAIVDGIAMRTMPSLIEGKPAAGAESFRGMRLLRLAEEVLTLEGVNTRGMSQREIAERALNISARAYHSTSDFPEILGDAVNRTLRRAYELQPRTFMPFCRRGVATDFREMNKVQLSGVVGAFDEVIEGAEYKYGSAKDAVEKYAVAKYGKIIAITWESLINDDLSAFTTLPTAIAAKAAQKQSDIVYAILLDNPNMGDGVALFDNAHGNLGAATAINETGLSAARKAMRDQKSLEGDYINVMPAYMIVGNAKETEAQKLLEATIVATKTADTNIFRGYTDLIVEPRITGTKWFLAANPNSIDTIEYSFLDGESELFTEQRTGFEVDGLEIKARMVFGAKAIDWRGLYYNPGA